MSPRSLVPPFLLLAALAALLPIPGGSPYWPIVGLWAMGICVLIPLSLGGRLARPGTAAALLLLMPAAASAFDGSPHVSLLQLILIPELAFLLSYLTLYPRESISPLILPGLSALLASAFVAVSGLSLYYIDRIFGTSLIPTNSALMWQLSAGLLGILAMFLLFFSHALLKARRAKG